MAATQTATKPAAAPPPPVQAAVAPPAPPAQPPAAAPAAERAFAPLPPRRFLVIRSSENGDLGNLFAAVLPAGVPFSDCLRQDFWSNCAHIMARRGDGRVTSGAGHQIEIHTDDTRFFGRLYVRRVHGVGTNNTYADVEQIEYHEFSVAPRPTKPIPHVLTHMGPLRKFCIVRTSDGTVVSENHETEADAMRVLQSMVRKDSVA